MINVIDALKQAGGALALAPVFLSIWGILLIWIRRIKCQKNDTPRQLRKLYELRIASCLCFISFLTSLLWWVGVIMAVGFNWDHSDVKEIELLVFANPYPLEHPEQRISINDTTTIANIFNGIELLKPPEHTGSHHPIGRTFVLRLRRQSDNEWSDYRLEIYPDAEYTEGFQVNGVYDCSIPLRNWGGGRYHACELGKTVEYIYSNHGDSPSE